MVIEKALFDLYSRQSPLTNFHIKTRYRRARFWELLDYLPESGYFLDIGCGHGMFANILALSSPERNVLGMDISEAKISIAQETVGRRSNIKFSAGDISTFNSKEEFDAITLIEVLYLVAYDIQKKILPIIYKHLNTKGILLINEVCREKSLGFYRVLLQENISVRVLHITAGEKFYFRSGPQWQELLKKSGFHVTEIRRKTANPSNLYICRKS